MADKKSSVAEISKNLIVFPMSDTGVIKKAVNQDKKIIAKTIAKLPAKFQKDAKKAFFFVVNNQVLGMQQNISIGRKFTTEELEGGYKTKLSSAQKEKDGFFIAFNQPLIVLNFTKKISETEKMNLVAHEIAHMFVEKKQNFAYTEQAVDDLVEQWGFKRSYTNYDVLNS